MGDLESDTIILAGDKLNNFEICLNLANEAYNSLLKKKIEDNYHEIISKFSKINANGKTALGPALLASIGLASKVYLQINKKLFIIRGNLAQK